MATLEFGLARMDPMMAQIQDDSDFDIEPELPSLEQVLGKDVTRKLKPKEKMRQNVINELFYTEKCHVRTLKIMDKLFYQPMLQEQTIPQVFTKGLFPNLETIIHLHGSLNNSMKKRRKEKTVISNVGDILLQRFDGKAGENFRSGCAIFCRNQSHKLETLTYVVRKDPKLAQLLSDAEKNPLCQRQTLKDIISKEFQRLTKYPLFIENLLKYTQINTEEYSKLEKSLKCAKRIIEYVYQAVKDFENHQRLIDLQRKVDRRSIDNSPEMNDLRTFDFSKHKLLHDGPLTWSISNRKEIELHVVLLERVMVLLQKQNERLVLKLQSTHDVTEKYDARKHSPLLWLDNVFARLDATDKEAFFVVNSTKTGPQIYKFVARNAEEQRTWVKYITQASEAMKKNMLSLKKGEESILAEQTRAEKSREKQAINTYLDSEVPDELASDPRTLELYEAAIREGKERDRNIRVMVVGCYGQGKSSLVRHLTGQSLEGVESTNGIEIQLCESIVDKQEFWTSKCPGDARVESVKRLATVARLIQKQPLENTEHISIPVSFDNSDTFVAEKTSTVARPKQKQPLENVEQTISNISSGYSDTLIAQKTTSGDNKLAQQSDAKEPQFGMELDVQIVSGGIPTKDSLEFVKEITKNEEQENKLQEKTREINIWDFGGQFVNYATHQLFHSRQAIYILVFDISKGLDVKVYDEECPYNDNEKSMEEYLKFWIRSVHSFVGNEEGTEPPIFLVGTHLDRLNEHIDQRERFEDVRKLFDNTLCAFHLQPEQFAVSNTNPNHATFARIRRAITAYAKKSEGLFIPAKWIPLERSLKENRHLKIITFQRVKEFDGSNDIPIASEDQLKLFLKYHHEKGTFFYFENDNDAINHVVLDPQFLIDAFRCIITADKFCCVHQNLRLLWQKLRDEAVLEKELLDQLWKKESDKEFMKFKKPLLFFLQRHRILAEALTFDEASSTPMPLNFYIVPSLLKKTSEGMIDDFLKGKRYTEVSIGYYFEYVSTLCTVYNRVIAAALGRWPILKFRSTSLVYENAVVCKLNPRHSGILKRQENSLELLVVNLCPEEDVSVKDCDAFRRFAEMVIQEELHKFQKSDFENQSHGYRKIVRCYHEDHGYSGSCDVYDFDTLQTYSKDTIGCPDHLSHIVKIKDIMTEWFNADIVDADVPKRTLTEKELSKLSTSIGKNWEHLARMLGFTDAVIEQVFIDKITTAGRIYEVLKRWSAEQLDRATLDVLISAIRECGPSLTVSRDTLNNLIDGTLLSRQY